MFKGSYVALVTPFVNRCLDIDSLRNLINFHLENGTNGIIVGGSTGEGLLLTINERKLLIEKSIEFAQNKIPIIVGCSFASTKEALECVTLAQKYSANGILVIVPFYVKPTQAGIIQHFEFIHNNSDIPIIMYNNPSRCSVNMEVTTIEHLSRLERIVSLKDSDPSLERLAQIKSKNLDLTLLSGDDASLCDYITCGGDGAISVVANVIPRQIKNMINSSEIDAQKINDEISDIIEAMSLETNPIPIKYALFRKKIIKTNEMLLPLTSATEQTMFAIDKVINE